MNIGSRLEAGDSAENDQMAIKRRVESELTENWRFLPS